MDEQFDKFPEQPETELKSFTLREIVEDGRVAVLSQQLAGNSQPMIDIFGKEMTIAELNEKFTKQINATELMKIAKLLGYEISADSIEALNKKLKE